ncbi:alpha/beta hydrolase [Flavobacteriaceae bacterium]|jgi:pimeloyl-ACP methyl ester carboxylesterase|nr:alpha/beta hydrolase [Flavobacteriaceae bacterium]MDB4227401.1 alpha/beta hydrolase [Flavobacteriaceae bacterium]
MKIVNLYCMPGMAASPKIFEFISLPKPIKIHLLSWIPPLKDEPLTDYAIRMCERVTQTNPILLGVSFGGVLVQEMSKYLPGCQVVIVSSIKSKDELPLSMKMAKKTNAHKLLPMQWINNLDNLSLFVFGEGIQKRLALYQKYLSERNPDYLSWAIDSLVNWDKTEISNNIIHIHGEKDTVFPIKNLSHPFIKIKGGHAAIITQAHWFNKELSKILLKD